MSDGSIAIIGASCRFPGAPDLEAFWELLISGADAVREVDDRRWSTRFYYHPGQGEPARSYTWSAGLLTDIDLFEPAFFGIKTAVNQTQTSIVPAEIVEFDSSGLRVLTHRELVQHGPGMPCDDPISPEFESAVHDYYGTPQPVQIRRGTLRKKARRLSPAHPAAV